MSTEVFANARFVGEDFDGTIVDTFTRPKDGYSVESAYHIAVGTVFGPPDLEKYKREGGLGNRAPLEIVRQLAPDADAGETDKLHQQLVATKLEVLESQISATWPEPTKGFIEFTAKLRRTQAEQPIDDVIISSGHESFIRKTFEKTLGITPPKIILAQEAIQRMAANHDESMPTKPSPKLMVYAYDQWQQSYGQNEQKVIGKHDCERMCYVGDDDEKDGGMARATGVAFYHLVPENAEVVWQKLADDLALE